MGFENVAPKQPRWDGSPLEGRTILLCYEQGHGDTMQFIRYAEMVKQQGGTVIVECQAPLVRLLAGCAGVDQVIAHGEPRPPFDVHIPLLNLPGVFHTSLETVPAKVPYLAPDPEAVTQWKKKLGRKKGLKIGIAWQGNPDFRKDCFRSIPLTHFGMLAETPGVRLFSLQFGTGREQLAQYVDSWPITDLGDELGDFSNTAAIMKNLDLVITSDSAPAHLAGALGLPVWVALTFAPDWRWMAKRADSPWYPTMRLFRQTKHGDWAGVLQEIQAALAELVSPAQKTSAKGRQ